MPIGQAPARYMAGQQGHGEGGRPLSDLAALHPLHTRRLCRPLRGLLAESKGCGLREESGRGADFHRCIVWLGGSDAFAGC